MSDGFLETADRIGAGLCRDAIWSGGRCTWMAAVSVPRGGEWVMGEKTCGSDVYGGTAGIALFLDRLASLTGEAIYARTARGALAQSLARLPENRWGYYAGVAGIAVVAGALGEEAGAVALLARLDEGPIEDTKFDVVGGSAGGIVAALAVGRRRLAVRLGNHLLKGAKRSALGWSWSTVDVDVRDDLTGFAHGASGIAWALLELHRATGEARFLDAAKRGFLYERHWYHADRENWADLRSPEGPVQYALAWCHGAPGVGLARARAYALLGDETSRAEKSFLFSVSRRF